MAGPGMAITVALLATTAYHLGLVLEKRALGQLPAVDARHAVTLLRTVFTEPAWLAGFALMLCGFGLQAVALTLAQVSVIQPVLGSGVVILVVASRIVLREKLGRLELASVLAMALAILAIALSAGDQASQVGRQASGVLIAAVVIPACAVAALLGASSLRPATRGRHRFPSSGVSYGLSSGLLYGVATLAIKALSGIFVHHTAGMIGLALGVAQSPYPYVTLGCSAAGMVIFQTGLQRCRVSIVGPVSNITGSVFFMVAGTWLFAERLPADPAKLVLRLAGIVAAGMVVVVLSRRPARAAAPAITSQRAGSGDSGAARVVEAA